MSEHPAVMKDTWIDDWREYLQSADLESEISRAFAARWESKKPAKVPGGLTPSATADPTLDWSLWLERFLLANTDGAERYADDLVSAIEKALALHKHSQNNIVWIRDVLALRRVVFGNDDTRVRAARLILTSLRVLAGVNLHPVPRDYDQYDKLLGLASRAMVAELYEENFSDAWEDGDLSAADFGAFSVLWYLEEDRRNDTPTDAPTVWSGLGGDYQLLADDLFETLININAQAMQKDTVEENKSAFLVVLRKFKMKSNSEIHDYARFLGLQRTLDIHLVRFSVIVSDRHRAHAALARKFVEFMSRCDGALRSQVRRSILLKGLTIPLLAKRDPRRTLLTVDVVNEDAPRGKLNLIPGEKLDELASTNPEIAEAMAEEFEG